MQSKPRLDTYHLYEHNDKSYEELYEEFEWEVPEDFNLGYYTCDKWSDQRDKTAYYYDLEDVTEEYTFGDVIDQSDKFAEFLLDNGISANSRIGICLSQRPQTAITQLGAWKIGAVTVPMSILSGEDTIEYKVSDSEIELVVTEEMGLDAMRGVAADSDSLDRIVTLESDLAQDDEWSYEQIQEEYSGEYEPIEVTAEDDAIINYTSGTTGKPKGVLHAHRHLLGILPEWLMGRNMEVRDEDVYRTVVDWSWAGSLNYVVLPSLFVGVPLVATGSEKFDAEREFELIDRYGVSVLDAPATALRKMMQIDDPGDKYDLSSLRVITSGGEGVGDTLIEWMEEVLGAHAREGYGQTEALAFVGDCPKIGVPHKEGKMGVPVPGHRIKVMDPNNPEEEVELGEVGELVLEENPLVMKEYLNKPEKTEEVLKDGWLYTGDLVREHEDGYIEFIGRKDGVIISSGYRIGPEEIEDSICELDSVADAAVVGVPDDELGEVPKAFVVPAEGYSGSEELKEEITEHTRDQLAKYKYPREIAFIDELPTTTTGKIARNELKDM